MRAFQGKKILLTLALPPDTDRKTAIDKINSFQVGNPTRRDKDQARLIGEMVKKALHEVTRLEEDNVFHEGKIIFTGRAIDKAGNDRMVWEVIPYISVLS